MLRGFKQMVKSIKKDKLRCAEQQQRLLGIKKADLSTQVGAIKFIKGLSIDSVSLFRL